MLNILDLNTLLGFLAIIILSFKDNKNKKIINLNTKKAVNNTRFNPLKKRYTSYVSSRSFCSSNVKFKAKTFVSIKDLTSNLQAESSADAARRINTNPNPNRIACLVRRIYTIFIERDLDTKINNMNDLLLENIWTENQEMGDKAKIALDKMLRHEVLEGEEVFDVDNFFLEEGISLEGLRLEDLRSKIETCQNFYSHKYSELQEKLNIWNEEKNNLLLQQDEEYNKDKGKEPDYSLHPSYNRSEIINNNNMTKKDDFLFIKSDKLNYTDELDFNCLDSKKRNIYQINGLDICDEGKIVKKAKTSHNTSLVDDYADISCEPLDIIDLDG